MNLRTLLCICAYFNFYFTNGFRVSIKKNKCSHDYAIFVANNNHPKIKTENFLSITRKLLSLTILLPYIVFNSYAHADDELAKYAAEGNNVGVDGQCFMKKCAIESYNCASDPNCVKGLSCLARCKGGSMCSTGCFAKFGSVKLDNLLHCTIEKNDCVHVPKPEGVTSGWTADKLIDLPSKPVSQFDPKSLDGVWYKVMGLDSRYDCFDCQKNTFSYKDITKTKNSNAYKSTDKNYLTMEALFRIPRPSVPNYMQNVIEEELLINDGTLASTVEADEAKSHFLSKGQMFGLTFWENWYILGDTWSSQASKIPVDLIPAQSKPPDLKLVYYTGHTLQGTYKGAFIYARSPELTPQIQMYANELISSSGLNPNKFCIIRNQCFAEKADKQNKNNNNNKEGDRNKDAPNWF